MQKPGGLALHFQHPPNEKVVVHTAQETPFRKGWAAFAGNCESQFVMHPASRSIQEKDHLFHHV